MRVSEGHLRHVRQENHEHEESEAEPRLISSHHYSPSVLYKSIYKLEQIQFNNNCEWNEWAASTFFHFSSFPNV